MDEKDREILRMLQDGFPLTPRPYQEIGDKLWIDEMTVISRLVRMNQTGTVRHVGPFFNTRKLGFTGILAAINVPENRIEEVAEIVSSFHNVTHNYQRDGNPNLWFTIISRDKEEMEAILSEIREKSAISEILLFPSQKQFKVRTDMAL